MTEVISWSRCFDLLSERIPTVLLLLHRTLEENVSSSLLAFIWTEREGAGEKHCISGQCLLIATRHTSPQLSQIAIEKWPVMQLLANPGPRLPSIIKSCLSRGPLSGLSWCVVSLSHLPATGSPAAAAGSGTRFPSATSHSVAHIRWYGQTKKLKLLHYIFRRLQWKWGGEGRRKMGFGFFPAHYHWAREWYLQRGRIPLWNTGVSFLYKNFCK